MLSCSCYVDATSMAWGGVGWRGDVNVDGMDTKSIKVQSESGSHFQSQPTPGAAVLPMVMAPQHR